MLVLLVSHSLSPSQSLLEGYSFSQVFYDKSGNVLRFALSNDEKFRLSTNLSRVSPAIIDAVVQKEDRWFFWHPGINPVALLRASYWWTLRRPHGGASTITMQLARMLSGRSSRTLQGKLQQVLHAIWLDLWYSKKDILQAYLTLAPFGGNIEGVESAARIYFGKAASELTPDEAYLLAVIPQRPAARTPGKDGLPADLTVSASTLYERAYGATDKNLVVPRVLQSRKELPFRAPHFVEIVRRKQPMKEQITTTLDLALQGVVEGMFTRYFDRNRRIGLTNGAALVVDARDRSVVVAVGSTDYWNEEIDGKVNGLRARRSPGSALKPFTYALALDRGLIHPQSLLYDTSFFRSTYNPENFDGQFMGPISATEALVRSRNIPAIQLLQQLTYPSVHRFFQSAGVREMRSPDFYGLALVVGGVEVTLQEMATLYLMLARGGTVEPLKYTSSEGDNTESAPVRLLSPEAAFLTLEILRQNPRPSEGFGYLLADKQRRFAWKTGTSNGYRDAWAVGVVGPYVLVVWLGNFDNTSNPALVGREAAGPLFFAIADALESRLAHQPHSFYAATQKVGLSKTLVCAVSGSLPTEACERRKSALLIPGVSPIEVCSVHRYLHINRNSGKRECHGRVDEQTIRKSYEFWPSDVLKLFAEAGLPRRIPPPFDSECPGESTEQTLGGKPPRLLSPQSEIVYSTGGRSEATVPFLAVTDTDSPQVYWFVDNSYYGSGNARDPMLWRGRPGSYVVRVVDSHGRASQRTYVVAGTG